MKSTTALRWLGRSTRCIAAIYHGKWAGARICYNCQARMKGGPLSSQTSKLVWPHKAVCVMNGGDLDPTGRKYVRGKAHWIWFYVTLLRRSVLALVTTSVPRTGWLFIDRVTENDMWKRLLFMSLLMHNWRRNIIVCAGQFGVRSTVTWHRNTLCSTLQSRSKSPKL